MKPEQKYSLIHKYLSKQANSAEKEQVEAWAKHSKSAQKEFDTVQNIWEQSANIDFDLDPATDKEWAKLKKQAAKGIEKPIKRKNYSWIAVAAAVVVLLGGFWLVQQFGAETVQEPKFYATEVGERKNVVLADGSKVFLNASSQLTVDAGFDINNRIVKLEGEAWFEVTKQKEGQPFTIKLDESEVRVLGTQFNVQAYKDFQTASVQVAEGKVAYSTINKQSAELIAGQAAVYNKKTQKLLAKNLEDTDITALGKGVIIFDRQPFSEVLIYLERKFAVSITNQTKLDKEPYSASFENEELEGVLTVLGATFSFEVEQKGKEIILKK